MFAGVASHVFYHVFVCISVRRGPEIAHEETVPDEKEDQDRPTKGWGEFLSCINCFRGN